MATERIRAMAEKFLVRTEQGYAVLRIRTLQDQTITAVGKLADVPLGTEAEWVGRYTFHAEHGKQFAVNSWRALPPTSETGIERFLASGLFKGVGPQTAKRLVAHFGVHTLTVLQESPDLMQSVPGLSPKRVQSIVEGFKEHHDVARLATFLRGHSLPLHLADKLTRTYGSGAAALEILTTNPYQAVEDVRGIGFRTADALAQATGIARGAPERISAGLLYLLAQAEDDGHMYLPFPEWIQQANALLQLADDEVGDIATRLIARSAVVCDRFGDEACVYTARMHRVEARIAEKLVSLVAAGVVRDTRFSVEDSLTLLQREAAMAAQAYPLVVITGGPGTGKTTTVRRIVEDALDAGEQVIMAAPTGRAAKRLTQSTGYPASTLHRLLEVGQVGGRYGFGRNADKPLVGNLFILDEVSMLDAPLFLQFLDAVPEGARLVLVGDPEQLPAVGPGAILRDIIRTQLPRVFALQLVFRQSAQSDIVLAAHAVRAGKMPTWRTGGAQRECFFIAQEDARATAETVIELAAVRLPQYLGVDPKEGVQVLTPMRKGACGFDRLNAALSERLTLGTGPTLLAQQRVFRIQDKVMNIKNDYERDVYNGDMGIVQDIAEDGLTVRFGGADEAREYFYGRSECSALTHAYAISVHKSQGGEYPCVILPIVREHAVMLYRQLVYTAMTRARQLLVVVGSAEALQRAVRREDGLGRYSHMGERIEELRRMRVR